MATGGKLSLTLEQIAQLAAAISSRNMEAIAVRYLGISMELLESLRDFYRDPEAFNREILQKWAYKNSGPDQVTILASILYRAAREGSYVNPEKVHEILRVPDQEGETNSSNSQEIKDEEFHAMVESLQKEAKSMKMPMAKWAKGYHVKVDDVYTDLDLQTVDNKLSGPVLTAVGDYKDLFDDDDSEGSCQESNCSQNDGFAGDGEPNSESQKCKSPNPLHKNHQRRKRVKPSKILFKGDPGNGKTNFSKKVLVDWAKGVLVVFSVVFFVSMKLVRPGDDVENVIINQSPALKRLGISKPKLQAILRQWGASILIILDGMDEHDLQNSSDFLDLIQGAKPFACTLLVTSRSHKLAELEHYFETVVQCQGFTPNKAQQYVSNILKNEQNIQPIVRFVGGHNFGSSNHIRCPMIILFICVLMNNEDSIDIDNLGNNLGEIFTRLICSVYKAYCDETKIRFQNKRFERLLLSLGKIANEIQLQKKGGYYKKEHLIGEVGEEAFDSGLLIGHEDDYNLLTREADICVTFSHDLIGWFFTAFFATRLLGHCETTSGFKFPESFKNIEELSLLPNVLTDRVVTQFFMWFLSDKCSAKYFQFTNRGKAFCQLAHKVSKYYDVVQLNLAELYSILPALGIMQTMDPPLMNFLAKSLSLCQNIMELYLNHMWPVHFILESIGCLPSLKLIVNTGVINKSRYEKVISTNILNDNDNLVIIESARNPVNLMTHLGRFNGRRITLCVTGEGCMKPFDVSDYLNKYVSRLEFTDFRYGSFVNCEFQQCQFLSEILFINSMVGASVLDALGAAMKGNKLPVLSSLSFQSSGSSVKGKLNLLFQSTWPTLKHFNLRKCELDQSDVHFLAPENGFLPNLTKLCFGFSVRSSNMENRRACCSKEHVIDDNVFSVFRQHWVVLTTLSLHDVCKRQYQRIAPILNPSTVPCLSDLAIFMWQHSPLWRKQQVQINTCSTKQQPLILWEQADKIDKMPEINHPGLRHLTLHRFVCAATHLHAVARSALSCKLEKLDISHSSYVTGHLFVLVSHSFPSLRTLILSQCQLNSTDLENIGKACTKGKLPKLRMLDISHNSNVGEHLNLLLTGDFESLQKLILKDCALQIGDLKSLAIASSNGWLPELRHLDISTNIKISGKMEHLFCYDQNWPDLLSLKSEQYHVFGHDFEVLISKIGSCALGSLQDLTVSCEGPEFLFQNGKFEGSNLRNLKIVSPFRKCSKEILLQFFY